MFPEIKTTIDVDRPDSQLLLKHLTRKIILKNVTRRFDVSNVIFKSEKCLSFKFVKRVEV